MSLLKGSIHFLFEWCRWYMERRAWCRNTFVNDYVCNNVFLMHWLPTGEITSFKQLGYTLKFKRMKNFTKMLLRITVLRENQLKGFWSPITPNLHFCQEFYFPFRDLTKQWLVIIIGFETNPTAFPFGKWRYVTQHFIITVYFSWFLNFTTMLFSGFVSVIWRMKVKISHFNNIV